MQVDACLNKRQHERQGNHGSITAHAAHEKGQPGVCIAELAKDMDRRTQAMLPPPE